jgi:hypothetical protein
MTSLEPQELFLSVARGPWILRVWPHLPTHRA